MGTATYRLCKSIIKKGNYEFENMLMKLDVFLLNDRVTPAEYKELVKMMQE